MLGRPGRAWGKLCPRDPQRGDAGDGIEWHPLVDHCADVAACAAALLAQPTIAARLGLDPFDRVRIERLAALAFLHDLGKANCGFQNKQHRQPDGSYPRGLSLAGHVREVSPLFTSDRLSGRLADVLPLAAIAGWDADAAILGLLAAVISHHGTPFDPCQSGPDPYGFARLWEATADGYDPFAAIAELASALERWFPVAFDPGGGPLPDGTAFQHAFAGLVMLADWLGSDTGFFRYSHEGDGDRMTFAREQAATALRAVGIDVGAKRTWVAARQPAFGAVFPAIPSPNPMQVAAGRLDIGRLAVLEAETGSGKTEAALWRFRQLFAAGAVDGLYFALPTRIAATQIHERVRRAAERLFAADDRPAVVLAVPGYLRVDDVEGRLLPGFAVQWSDDLADATAHKRWAAENPKRFLAAQIAVGTIDQALLSNLMVRHAHLRSTALLRHLLVIDEVHASDVYTTRLLASVLAVHVGAGGHALLMSATLGAAARRRLLLGSGAEPPSPAEAAAVPYPSLYWTDGGEERIAALAATGRNSKTVALRGIGEIDVPAAIARRALDAARSGAKVLVVRNTVRAAITVQQAVEAAIAEAGGPGDAALLFRCAGIATLHHGRFAREDRVLLDRAVEARLGRERPEGGGIVVGTQTLEQSLDIDADLLICDLCPMDVLLQRLGRLHRHPGRDRPAGYARAQCLVLTFAERDLSPLLAHGRHGLGPSRDFRGVYPDVRIIEATWRLVERHAQVEIPAMNRPLVEGATHPEVLEALCAGLGAAWQEHGNGIAGRNAADRSIAGLQVICRDQPFQNLHFPGGEEHVQTRLGADSRLLDFGADGAALPTGPFGTPVRVLTLPEHLCRGIQADAPIAITGQREHGFGFRFGDQQFAYGGHGLEKDQGQ